MSFNSSSPSNTSQPPSFSTNIYSTLFNCTNTTAGALNITIFTITNILVLLPLYICVLYLGLQQWRQQHSSRTVSQSDIFTYHMVAKELMNVLGSTLICCGVHSDLPIMMMIGIYLCSMTLSGQMYFHLLTCAERYLAVIHPIAYLSLRKESGIRITNLCIGCVWLLSFVWICIMSLADQHSTDIFYSCVTVFALSALFFCSLSVLCVLIRPGPGEGGGGRQSKLRAFYTIMAILGVLVFRFGGNGVATSLYNSPQLGETERCGLWLSVFWFSLPSSLVLPLLFLQRTGKLLCCKKNNQSQPALD